MRKITFAISCLFLFCLFPAWAQLDHSVFLFGDGGKPANAPENLEVLRKQLEAADENSTIIFLGDNIYHDGLPDKDHKDRNTQEEKLKAQLDITKKFKGNVIVIPGNHDWDNSGSKGWDRVSYQTKYVQKYFDSKKVFYPKNGKPGPEEIQLDDGLYLIVLDLQWMLHRWEKPMIDDQLMPHKGIDVLIDLGELLEEHKNDHVIVAAHHPIYSYGKHGGKFPLKAHLFPLTEVNKSLYIPLPIIGSIYPGYRATAGSLQDIPHPQYKAMRNAIEEYLIKYPNVVYVAGHEHNLQHIVKDKVNYVVSGSGSKTAYIKKYGKHLKFGESRNGFGKIDYSKTQTSLELWAADQQSPNGEKIYESGLYKKVEMPDKSYEYPTYHFDDSVKTSNASDRYGAGNFKKWIMGENYREVWKTPVNAPIFNISEEHGGLSIIKKGGGLQTNSLRMEAKDGKQYVLRSLEKYPERAIPDLLKKTFAEQIVQDQMSASNPYGAFVVPYMAEAVGIYHTNPKLVFVPDDGALGKHRETFANTLVLYEERPAKAWSDAAFFGNSYDLVNSDEVFEELQEDNDNFVDQKWALRSRMFDMTIADWDRHEDQWRWASFDEGEGKMYRPIPRDRDQTFFVNEGVLPRFASRKWAMPRVEGFNPDVRWAPGFNFNARHFDRWFLNEMNRKDWIKMADEVKEKLSDKVIDDALKKWPKPIYDLEGENTANVLKQRRDKLPKFTLELYESLAKEVEILGSDKKELVTIENYNRDSTRVTIQKISKKGKTEQTTYVRTFLSDETKEVRIYGFGDDDQFEVKGTHKGGIKIRVIGGKGKDEIRDLTAGKSAGNVLIYDRKHSTQLPSSYSFKNRLSDKKDINRYERYAFKYDQLMPLVYGSLNPDDGLFLGGGYLFTSQGWRKKPFASRHFLLASGAFASGAFQINYMAEFTDVVGKWNLEAKLRMRQPNSDNFFGLGNDSEYDIENNDIDFYRLRMHDNRYQLALTRRLGMDGKFEIGAQHRGVKVIERQNTFLSSDEFEDFDTDILFDDLRMYTGAFSRLSFDTRDEIMLTTRGLLWNTQFSAYKGISDNANDHQRFSTELALYYSFQFPAIVTIASRTGYAETFSKYRADEFYITNTLGGRSNLRGFRRSRFYGKTSFYQNVDLRIKLFNFQSILFPGRVGIHGFYDVGRVWRATDTSDQWHRSAGFGAWIAPLHKAVLSVSFAFTGEENLGSIDFGFFF